MSKPPHDPRAVANLLLDLADQQGLNVTNLALQKLVYFAHGHFLIGTSTPLVQGYFEAWQHGPVHPAIYKAFKSEGNQPIKVRASGLNLFSGASTLIESTQDTDVKRHLWKVLASYGDFSASYLREISHAPRGPWATVVNKAKTSVALGMRIQDNVIIEHFKFHKVFVGLDHLPGEPNEDSPFA